MFIRIANSVYLEVEDLEQFGINRSVASANISYYSKQRNAGKFLKYWLTVESQLLGNKKIIKYNSLPSLYFKKFNLPTEAELKQSEKLISIADYLQIQELKKRNATLKLFQKLIKTPGFWNAETHEEIKYSHGL